MAMATVVRRWPAASQMRTMLLGSGRQSRAYATNEVYSGKGLDEKEKAAESRYIRQQEDERLQKLKKKTGETAQHPAGESPASTPGKVTSADGAVSGDSGRTTAVVAGIVAIAVAGYWWFSGAKKEDKESI